MARRDLREAAEDTLRSAGHLAAIAALLYLSVYVAASVVMLASAADITFWTGLTLSTIIYIRLRSRHARREGRTYHPTGVAILASLALLVGGVFQYTTRPGLSFALNATALVILLAVRKLVPNMKGGSSTGRDDRPVRQLRQGPRNYDRRGLNQRERDNSEKHTDNRNAFEDEPYDETQATPRHSTAPPPEDGCTGRADDRGTYEADRGPDARTDGPAPARRRRRPGVTRGRNSTQRPDRTDNADPDLGRP